MVSRVQEPNYSEFAYRSGLTGQQRISLDAQLGRYAIGGNDGTDPWLTEDDVQTLVNSTIIPSSFSVFRRRNFSAPRPVKVPPPPRPENPMYSGKWGRPAQVDLPPEPKITLRRTDLRLFGFPLSPINRYIDGIRKERADRQLKELRQEWDRQFKQIKVENQEAVLNFERRVQGTTEFRVYLAEDRRWLEIAAATEAEFD